MRLAFRVALAAASLLALIAAPATARAMGAVVSSPPGASSAIAVRVAVAVSDEPGAPTAKWGSITVQGSATAFAWIVPARPGALLQLSPDAWLEALEEATAPRVVPPDATPPCDFPGGAEVEGSFTPTATTAPGAVSVATDRATLDAALASWGLSVTPELSPAIDAVLASGSDLVAMLFTDTSGTIVTRTFRVVDDAPVAVPLSLTTAGANAVQVTAFALRSSSPAFGAQPDLTVDPTAILWRSDGTSSYASARDTMLDANPGRWLLETSGPTIVSTPTTLPDGSTVPSLTAAYESLLANAGDAGTSDDLAVALGAGDAGDGGAGSGGETWLARGRTTIPAGSLGEDAPITDGTSDAIGPLVTAAGYAQTCEASAPPAMQQGGTSGGAGGGSGGTSSNEGTGTGAAIDLGAGAAQAAADSTDGCGGDSTDSSGDGCGGDTSTSGSDSSSSDSSDGCSGSSTDSSGDSGGGCSGSSDSSSSSDCSVESGNGRRTPKSGTSRFLVLGVGIAALWRRRARRR